MKPNQKDGVFLVCHQGILHDKGIILQGRLAHRREVIFA